MKETNGNGSEEGAAPASDAMDLDSTAEPAGGQTGAGAEDVGGGKEAGGAKVGRGKKAGKEEDVPEDAGKEFGELKIAVGEQVHQIL